MRVMVFVKATKKSEEGALPSEQEFAEMGRFNEELVKAGVMLAGEGLHPSSEGKRLELRGDERTVVDGPFSETTELVAGFWIWQVASMEEALDWARRCPNPMPSEQGVLELRPIYELDEFGEGLTPKLREKEERLRAEMQQ